MSAAQDFFWPINLKRLDGKLVVFGWMRPDPIPCRVNTQVEVQRARQRPIKRSLIALKDTIAEPVPDQDLRFIFHASRCGSTLVSQILDQAPDSLSYSEHGFISKALLMDMDDGNMDFPILRACLDLLRPSPQFRNKKVVIRFSSWTSLLIKPIIERFTGVDWCFIYRDPLEIMVSHRISPAGWSNNPHAVTKHAAHLVDDQEDPVRFAAEVVNAFFTQAIAAPADRRCLVDYKNLKVDVMGRLFPHFGLELTDEVRVAIAQIMQFDAKRPEVGHFQQDTEFKQTNATQIERAVAVSGGVAQSYASLSAIVNSERGRNGNRVY
ncbi:hypothetical protein UF64_06915 [Thalassospira sp. HJ]|uniref:sulfotransferase family protein n=1 Tax=Thalassospira sp. HJ TaxID=1616823 RepID=UPI0005CF2FC3|nr:sulfotransferase family protein [Thalassospira sp. HJ]KJE35838.1 hypothetical protein UF64_06915 [Thalassospira sp. HJ]